MILVFDVGATHTRLALSADGNKLTEIVRMDTDPTAKGLVRLLASIGELGRGRGISHALGGLPVQLDGKGVIGMATNLPAWRGQPVVERIERTLGCEVRIGNDVTLCGMGEAHAGAGASTGVMVYFTVSTGVNAVRLVDGKIDPTIRYFEIGKQLVPGPGGGPVMLEELTGGAAFVRERGADPADVRDKRVWRAKERHLAHGLYNTFLHWTPDVAVLGGSMMRDIDPDRIRRELERLPEIFGGVPDLRKAQLGDTAGLEGALAWYREEPVHQLS